MVPELWLWCLFFLSRFFFFNFRCKFWCFTRDWNHQFDYVLLWFILYTVEPVFYDHRVLRPVPPVIYDKNLWQQFNVCLEIDLLKTTCQLRRPKSLGSRKTQVPLYLIGVCSMSSIRLSYANPKFVNNFWEFVRHRKDRMTSHRWRQVFADSTILTL